MNQNVDEMCSDASNSLLFKIYSILCSDEISDEVAYVNIVDFMHEDGGVTNPEICAKHLIYLFKGKNLDDATVYIEDSEIDIIKQIFACFWNDNIENAKKVTRRFLELVSYDICFSEFFYFALTEIIIYVDCIFYIELFEKYFWLIENCEEPFLCSDILYAAASSYHESGIDEFYDKAVEAMNRCIQLRKIEDFEGIFHARAVLQGALLKSDMSVVKSEIESILTFKHIQTEKDFLAECNVELGYICSGNDMLEEAAKFFENAVDEFSREQSSDYELYAVAYNSLCEMYSKINEFSKFYLYAGKAYDFCKKYNVHGENFIICINNFALSKFYLNDKVNLKDILNESKAEITEYGLENSVAAAYIYNTAAYTGNEHVFNKSVRELFEQSLNIFKELDVVDNIYILKMNNISTMLAHNEDLRFIKTCLDECNNDFVLQNDRTHMQLMQLYTEYYLCSKMKELAKESFLRCINIAEKVSYNDVIEIFINSYKICIRVFSVFELRLFLEKVPVWIEKRCMEIVTLKNEKLILDAIYKIDKLVCVLMLMNSEGYLDYSVDEMYEIIANVKSLYVCLLKDNITNLRAGEEFDSYRHERFKQISEDVLCLLNDQTENAVDDNNIDIVCNCSFRWTGISEIYNGIPDNSLILDYYAYLPEYMEEYYSKNMSYCIFAIKKLKNGKAKVIRLNDVSCEMAQDYLSIVLGEAKNKKLGSLIEVARYGARMGLYNKFVKPIEQYLEKNIDTIYFVPDADLCRVPFGILGVNLFQTLIDKYNIVYLDSTCCFRKDGKADLDNKGICIVGNPKFTLSYTDEMPTLPDGTRISSLGFSNIEAQTIADKFKVKAYLKKEANKKNILNFNAGILHIATHGYYFEPKSEQELYEGNPFNRSCIFVSGVNDWLVDANLEDNGIITASDLYYSNLHNMELVVLSACSSGFGEINLAGGIIGMRTILKALNSKYIILCLWEIDDLATAVFMNKLYDNISIYPIAEALAKTQRYLKKLTVKEMRNEGWFDEINIKRSGVSYQALVEFSKRDNNDIPFSNFKYWGGYIVCE